MRRRTLVVLAVFLGGCTLSVRPRLCPDGTVTTGTCPSPPPTAPPPTQPSAPPSTPPSPPPSTPPPPRACGLPPGTGGDAGCRITQGQVGPFDEEVAGAIVALPPGIVVNGKILDFPRYEAGVVDNLRRAGFCAFWDGAELAVKNSNAFSAQYDIVRSDGAAMVLYAARCEPALAVIPSSGQPPPSTPPSPPPSPRPCATPNPGPCYAAPEPGCTTCRDRLLWDLTHGDGAAKRAKAAMAKGATQPPPSTPRGPIPKVQKKGANSCPPDCHLYELPNSGEKFRDQLLYNDRGGNPAFRECFNWQCQKVDCRTRAVLVPQGWFGPLCEDKVEVDCPPPPPCDPPSNPPTAGECPPLRAIGAEFRHAICGGAAHPTPQRGCRNILDSTPLFGGGGPRFRCNREIHDACSPEGMDGGHAATAEHQAAARENRECRGYRKCEDPRGAQWLQLAGPAAGGCRDQDGNRVERSFLCRLDGLGPGTYKFQPCGDGWRDALGVENVTPDTCGQTVTFVVP